MSDKKSIFKLVIFGALLLAPVIACNPPTPASEGPTVNIVFPIDGASVTVGQQVLIQSSASDEQGIARVDLVVNAVVVRSDPPAEGTPTTFALAQPWFPETPGDVVVQVIAYNVSNQPSPAASITLHVVESAAGVEPTSVSSTSTPVPDVTGEGGCTLNATYTADLSIPDGSVLQPGVSFLKTWRILNSGTCDWGTGFTLVFVGGSQLGAPASVIVPPTASGGTVDISVPMVAPATPGTYKSNWRLLSNEGQAFGSTVWASIVVPSPVTNTPVATSTPTPTLTPEITATPEPPAAPPNLTMSTSTGGYVSLVWTDNASDEQGFHILADGEILHTVVGADNTGWGFMYSDYADVWCDKTVDLTVVAYRGAVWSSPSNAVQYAGPPCPPPVVAQGSTTMALGQYLDLDSGTVGSSSGDADLFWYKPGSNPMLVAENGTSFGVAGAVGPSVPSYTFCDSMTKSSTGGVAVPTLTVGTLLCYNTTAGNLAGIRVDEIQADEDIVLSFVTWDTTP
jgi:hypothetical protein